MKFNRKSRISTEKSRILSKNHKIQQKIKKFNRKSKNSSKNSKNSAENQQNQQKIKKPNRKSKNFSENQETSKFIIVNIEIFNQPTI